MSHYPPNYMPYGHYFSPFYLPHPAMQQFLSNGAFAQQPQASSVYPAPPPPSGAATGGKYTLPHHKPGSNTGNLTHVGMPGGYGPTSHGSFPAGYNPNSGASAGNSTSNEDLSTLQLKGNNGYSTTGQQVSIASLNPTQLKDYLKFLICRVKHYLYGLLDQDEMCRARSTVYSTMGNST